MNEFGISVLELIKRGTEPKCISLVFNVRYNVVNYFIRIRERTITLTEGRNESKSSNKPKCQVPDREASAAC